MTNQEVTIHTPVLLQEVIEGMHAYKGAVLVDATLGGGGYTQSLAEEIGSDGIIIAFDQDEKAIQRAKARLKNVPAQIVYVHANFRHLDVELKRLDLSEIDGCVFDLGLSSDQLEQSGRGFTFLKDEPLKMTFTENPESVLFTALDIVNEWKEESIADVIYGYGEERYARRIAKAIVESRKEKKIETTFELVAVVRDAVPTRYREGKIHPATKTFQALRIAVNDELGALEDGLHQSYELVRKGGRIVVVSFHSLEDRMVKRFFKEKAHQGSIILTKKPIVASEEELQANPRARSAKLRILEK